MNIDNKRKNFSTHEIESLISLLQTYHSVLENKTGKAVTNREKQDVWKCVAKEFNVIPGVEKRTAVQLQNLYKNLKKRKKLKTINGSNYSYHEGSDEEVIGNKYKQDMLKKNEAEEDTLIENQIEEVILIEDQVEVEDDIFEKNLESFQETESEASSSLNTECMRTEESSTSPLVSKSTSVQKNSKPYFRSPFRRDTSKSSAIAEAFRKQSEAKKTIIETESKLTLKLKIEKHKLKMKQMQEEHEAKMSVLNMQHEVLSKMSSYITSNSNNLSFNLFYNEG